MPEFEPIEEPSEGRGGGYYYYHNSGLNSGNLPDGAVWLFISFVVFIVMYAFYKSCKKWETDKSLTDNKATHTGSRTAYSSLA